ncbi:hypothetical protein M426DRAFT_50635 [Hypoxylon sp. CI-4A]|nr:hypothetical protein M426DRAFT_50635 [Hypoxylon sp. CI-4A]
MALQTETKSLLYKNFERHEVPVVESGSGIYLQTQDGRRILDATSGAAVASLGYGNEEVHQAITNQLHNIAYCHPGFYKTAGAEDLAELLVCSTNRRMSKAILCGSGSEAVEIALKLAITYFAARGEAQSERCHFITRVGSWHGATIGALALGDFKCRKDPFVSMLPKIESRVSSCNTYRGLRDNESGEEYVDRLAQELDDEFRKIGPHKVCAFVAETIGGSASGCATAVPGYFQAMKAVCARYGALLILDEVMCGMGRTGTVHAWEQEGIVPDIQCVGKGLGAGYCPISAVLVNSSLVSLLQQSGKMFAHGQTYMAHPLASAAALSVQKIIMRDNLIANVQKMGAYLGKRLRERLLPHPHVGNVRGRGLFWAVELVSDKQSKEPFPPSMELNRLLFTRGMKKGYEIALFNASGTYDGYAGDHFLLCPPFTVTEEDVDEIVERVSRVIRDTLAEL